MQLKSALVNSARSTRDLLIHAERKLPGSFPRLVSKSPGAKTPRWDLVSVYPSEAGRKLALEQKISYVELTGGNSKYSYSFSRNSFAAALNNSTMWIDPRDSYREDIIKAGVPLAENNIERIRALLNSPILRSKLALKQMREVWERDERFMNLPKVTVICSSNRPGQLTHVRKQFEQQNYVNKELLILSHGAQSENADMFASAEASLGECLNQLVNASSGELIAKFDDDDYYLPNYLSDQVMWLLLKNADLVGKESNYFYFPHSDAMALRKPGRDRRFTSFVSGATFLGTKDLFCNIPFDNKTNGEDSAFLQKAIAKQKRIFACDPHNFLVMRGSFHTWSSTEEALLSNASVETFGLNLSHIEA